MYESPITVNYGDIKTELIKKAESLIISCVENVGVDVNKDELVKALSYDRGQYDKGYADAKTEIVHCKDCKHFVRDDIEEYTPYGFYNTYFHAFCDKHWDNEQGEYIDVKIDDFCSFAERREVTD